MGTFFNSKFLWMSEAVGPAIDMGLVTPYCLAGASWEAAPNPSELPITPHPRPILTEIEYRKSQKKRKGKDRNLGAKREGEESEP